MIRKARFRSFKALADVSVDLERLTVLVGANACGKSSVLEGIDYVCQLAVSQDEERRSAWHRPGQILRGPRGPRRLLTTGHTGPLALAIDIEGSRSVALEAHVADVRPPDALFVVTDSSGSTEEALHLPAKQDQAPTFFRDVEARGLPRAARLRLDAAKLAKPSEDKGVSPRVAPTGAGLAVAIATLAEQRSPALDQIEADLRAVVPRARRLFTSREEVERTEYETIQLDQEEVEHPVQRRVLLKRLELEIEGAGRVPADLLSEGTLLVLGLLTVLHQPPTPNLVLLDDFDRGLHPVAQRELIGRMRALLEQKPDLQIVCTTHSPYALDYFEPDEVRVMRLDARGHAHCRRLTDHPEWKTWSASLKPGEFWSFAGEDWVSRELSDAG